MSAVACLRYRRAPVHRLRSTFHRHAESIPGQVVAWVALVAFSPFALLALLLGGRLHRRLQVGRHGELRETWFLKQRVGRRVPLAELMPRVWQIARGELAWVGPEARTAGQLDLRRDPLRRVVSVRPGLISTWWLRQRTNIAYGEQLQVDTEYVASYSWKKDLGIFLRSLVALVYGSVGKHVAETVEILGVVIDNVSMKQAVEAIVSGAARSVSFVNADCVNVAHRHEEYRRALNSSDLRLGDGIGLRVAGKILGTEIRQNVNGTDMFPILCERLEREGQSLYLLGGRPGVAEGVVQWVAKHYPALRVAGAQHGFFKPSEEHAVVERLNGAGADILLVAFGAPRQELWIARNRSALDVRAAIGVGGLFDFYSGRIPRAPQWLRELGMEWGYRLYQEPGRMWRRYLVGNAVFLARVLRAKWFRSAQVDRFEGEVISR